VSSEHADRLRSVKQKYAPRWLAFEGVVAVGIGTRDQTPCIVVSVAEEPSAFAGRIPSVVESVPVVVEPSGEIGPLE